MSKFRKLAAGVALAAAWAAVPALAQQFGLGRPALPDEIAAWDKDVRPDGKGLPVGSGSVETGEEVFSERCATCHGDFAEGVDRWPALSGGIGTLADEDPLKTVGSFWPYLTTTWDYISRSKPYGNAQTLTPDEVYAVLAYIVYSNDLVDYDFVLSNENLLDVEMPNAGGFIVDDRAEAELPIFSQAPCMANCKESVEITSRAAALDVTPGQAGAEAAAAAPDAAPEAPAGPDPALIAAGEKVFRKCKACHQVGEGAKNRTGPALNAVIGRTIGTAEGFRYSAAMAAMAEEGRVWDEAAMRAFLEDPRGFVPKTKMAFAGLKKEEDRAAIVAYLKSIE